MFHRIVPGLCLLLAVIAFGMLAGCGRKAPAGNRPEVVPVRGKVLHNSQPLEGATVLFIPEGGKQGAVGRTDSSGIFRLRTFDQDDGAVPGSFKVTIRKVEVSGDVDEDDGDEDAPVPEQKSLIPERYGNADSSGLTATVDAGGTNEFTFELED